MAKPPYRCKYWPRGCKQVRRLWVSIQRHERNCVFKDAR